MGTLAIVCNRRGTPCVQTNFITRYVSEKLSPNQLKIYQQKGQLNRQGQWTRRNPRTWPTKLLQHRKLAESNQRFFEPFLGLYREYNYEFDASGFESMDWPWLTHRPLIHYNCIVLNNRFGPFARVYPNTHWNGFGYSKGFQWAESVPTHYHVVSHR